MSRNLAGVYSLPAGSIVATGDTILPTQHNTPLNDIASDLNIPRPVVAGGTGADNAADALTNLGLTATAAEINSALDGITATATELNTLDGITATTAELNILDGVTATAAELNILDGVTATASEINALDGVTATGTSVIQAADATAARAAISTAALPNSTGGAVGEFRSIIAGVGVALALPSGGTWAYFYVIYTSGGIHITSTAGVGAGGATISGTSDVKGGFAWRIV